MNPGTVFDLLAASPAEPGDIAVVAVGRDGLVERGRQELLDQAFCLAAGLREAGLERGDRVALVAPNSIAWVVIALGVMAAGGVLVPLDAQMPQKELQFVLQDSEPRLLVTTTGLREKLEAGELDPAPLEYLLDVDAGAPGSWQSLLAPEPAEAVPAPDDMAVMFYTSGTTGMPKGVPLTHSNLSSNVEALMQVDLAGRTDRLLVPLPFHHVYPFTLGILVPLRLGAPLILPFSLVGPQIVRALQLGAPTIMLGVPRLYEAVWSALEGRVTARGALARRLFHGMLGLSIQARRRFGWRLGRRLFRGLHQRLAPGLRMVVSGGAALDPGLAEKLQALGWEVATGYGLSETSPILTFNPPERLRLESAGIALPGVELAIRPAGSRGEVLARGPNVFSGYWKRPDKTREALDEDGWYHTGDLGEMDDDGYLYLHGRQSAMIVLPGGENVDPERVEEALAKAEAIREAGILEQEGRLVAVVVPEPSAVREVVADELHGHLGRALQAAARALPSHHRPASLQVSPDPLPRTRLGKLRRHELNKLHDRLSAEGGDGAAAMQPVSVEAMAPEDQQLLSDPATEATWRYLAERYRERRLTPDTSLSLDLGLDSLAWVDLSLALAEQARVNLDDAAIQRIETVRDLLREAAGTGQSTTASAIDLVTALRDPEAQLQEDSKAWLAPRGPLGNLSGYLIFGLVRIFLSTWVRVEVRGRLPGSGPFLIAPRHLSALDPLALTQAMDLRQLQSLRWAGWTGLLFRGPFGRWFSRAAGILPVDPRAAPRNSLALAAAALARGNGLVWFPEGRRSPDGALQPFQPGIGLLLRARPMPVVPVTFAGTDRLMPIGRRFPRPGRVRVVIGEPIGVERLEAAGDDEQAIAELIRVEVEALSEEAGSVREAP